jgi:hypothetical protein
MPPEGGTMFVVVVVVCLAATGEQCQEFKFPGKEYTDVVSCIRDSQGEAAAWQLKNTKYTILGTRCVQDPKAPDAPNE